MSVEMKKMVNDPFRIGSDKSVLKGCILKKDAGFMGFIVGNCEKYCERYNIAKPVNIMDGNAEAINDLYEYLKQFQKYFRTYNKNLFKSDVKALQSEIEFYKKKSKSAEHFYKSLRADLDIARFKTLINSRGLNPMKMADGGELSIKFNYATLLTLLWIFIV